MVANEEQTAYYIAFGAHGPRALPPPGEGWKVAGLTAAGIAVSFVIFATLRLFAKGSPGTMNKEYQEATNEYLKVRFIHHLVLPCMLQMKRTEKRGRDLDWGWGLD